MAAANMPLAPPPIMPILKHPLGRRGDGDDFDSDSGGTWSEFKFEFPLAFKCEGRLLGVVDSGSGSGRLSDDP